MHLCAETLMTICHIQLSVCTKLTSRFRNLSKE